MSSTDSNAWYSASSKRDWLIKYANVCLRILSGDWLSPISKLEHGFCRPELSLSLENANKATFKTPSSGSCSSWCHRYPFCDDTNILAIVSVSIAVFDISPWGFECVKTMPSLRDRLLLTAFPGFLLHKDQSMYFPAHVSSCGQTWKSTILCFSNHRMVVGTYASTSASRRASDTI